MQSKTMLKCEKEGENSISMRRRSSMKRQGKQERSQEIKDEKEKRETTLLLGAKKDERDRDTR